MLSEQNRVMLFPPKWENRNMEVTLEDQIISPVFSLAVVSDIWLNV